MFLRFTFNSNLIKIARLKMKFFVDGIYRIIDNNVQCY